MTRPFWLWDTPHITVTRLKKIFQNDKSPLFFSYSVKMFSFAKKPEEVFRYMDKTLFCKNWPAIKTKIKKDTWYAHMAEHWQPLYEQALRELKEEGVKIHEMPDIDITPQRMNLARQIRNMRLNAGYTQKWVAKLLDVKQPFVSKLEAGKVNVSFDMLYKIAGACLKVKMEYRRSKVA